MNIRLFVLLAGGFLWIGFVSAISFMETWLKFRAPGITLSLGLGIGKLVFSALNKVEWACAFTLVAALFWGKSPHFLRCRKWIALPLLILVAQTFWLLPALAMRADAYIAGELVGASHLHLYYVFLEFLKVVSLLLFCVQVKNWTKLQMRDTSIP